MVYGKKPLPVILLKIFVVFGLVVKTLMLTIQVIQSLKYPLYPYSLGTALFFWLIGTSLSIGLLAEQKWAWNLSVLITVLVESVTLYQALKFNLPLSPLQIVMDIVLIALLILSRKFYMQKKY